MIKTIHFIVCLLFVTWSVSGQLMNMSEISPSRTDVRQLKAVKFSNLNNSVLADYAPSRYGDRIYFSSMYKESKKAKTVSRIFSFTPGELAVLKKDLNPKKSALNVAHVALTPDARRMYFTLCKDEAQEKCEIWYRDREYEGNWGAAAKLPDHINLRGYTATQPAIGWDVSLKKYVLYFVSDRPGSAGKKDIWCSPITWNGVFETPFPLPVNTVADDVTSYFDQTAQVLYFSSNGWRGFGKFDIFKARKTASQWSVPENMGWPFNTPYDDLYFTLHEPSKIAYFCSDRPGALSGKEDTGSWNHLDIYAVNTSGIVVPKQGYTPNQPQKSPLVRK